MKPGRIIELIESKNSISPNFSIELRERVATRRKGTFGEKGKAQLKLVLSLKNTGNSPIKKLIFQSTVMDESGEILPLVRGSIATSFAKSGLSGYSVGAFPAVIESRPLLLPGETRVVEGTIYVPDAVPNDLAKYDISISEVE